MLRDDNQGSTFLSLIACRVDRSRSARQLALCYADTSPKPKCDRMRSTVMSGTEERSMRKSLVLGAAALLALAGTALTPSDAEARWRGGGFGGGGFRAGGFHGGTFRGGGFYGGGFRAADFGGGFRGAGFARPAFGGYGWRGGYPRVGGY